MARFLSHDWVDAFNRALSGAALPGPEDSAGLAVTDGPVVVAEEVSGGPDGDVRLLLHIDGGTLHLERGASEAPGAGETAGTGAVADAARAEGVDADVTIALSYADAVAMSAGRLSPAKALGAGRIRVRGDLTVLAEAQRLLAAARELTGDLDEETTY